MAARTDPTRVLLQIGHSAVARIRVQNIMNPLLWLCGITSPTFIVAAYQFRNDHSLRDLLIKVAFVPLVLAGAAYIYWTFVNPDRLQSEEFQLQQKRMMFQLQGRPELPINVATATTALIPLLPANEQGGEDKP